MKISGMWTVLPAIVLTCCLSHYALAGALPKPLVCHLDVADRIVIGKIVKMGPLRGEPGNIVRDCTATVEVRETLKGKPVKTIDITVAGWVNRKKEAQASPPPVHKVGDDGIWLIKPPGSGRAGLSNISRRDTFKKILAELNSRKWSKEVNGLRAWAKIVRYPHDHPRRSVLIFAVQNTSKKKVMYRALFRGCALRLSARDERGKVYAKPVGTPAGNLIRWLDPQQVAYVHPAWSFILPERHLPALPPGKYSLTVTLESKGSAPDLWEGKLSAPPVTLVVSPKKTSAKTQPKTQPATQPTTQPAWDGPRHPIDVRLVPVAADTVKPGLYVTDKGPDKKLSPKVYKLAAAGKVAKGSRYLVARLTMPIYGLGKRLGGDAKIIKFERNGNRIWGVIQVVSPLKGVKYPAQSVYLLADLPELPAGRYEIAIAFTQAYRTKDGKIHAIPATGFGRIGSMTCELVVTPAAAAKAAENILVGYSTILKSKKIFVARIVKLDWGKQRKVRLIGPDFGAGYALGRTDGTAVFQCTRAIRGVKVGAKIALPVSKGPYVQMSMFERAEIRLGQQWLVCTQDVTGGLGSINGLAMAPGGNEPIVRQTQQFLQVAAMPAEKQYPRLAAALRVKTLRSNNPLVRYAIDHIRDDRHQAEWLETADILNAAFLDETNTSRVRYLALQNLSYMVQARAKTDLGKEVTRKVRRLLLEDAVALQSAEKGLLGDFVRELAGRFGGYRTLDSVPVLPEGLVVKDPAKIAEALRHIAKRYDKRVAATHKQIDPLEEGISRRILTEKLHTHLRRRNHCLALAAQMDKGAVNSKPDTAPTATTRRSSSQAQPATRPP